ncbi:MAG: YicC family protein [Rikenellaceae bacterium]|nr:YicC family protein [Rikenellaceae bacterium]
MTGFGKGEAAVGEKKFTVEMRSVNSKQLDLSLKVPGRYRAAEAEIRAGITRQLKRGKVECFVSVESATAVTSAHINREVFAAYAKQIKEACEESGLGAVSGLWNFEGHLIEAVLRMPDVVSYEEQQVSPQELEALLSAAEQAARNLNAFREQEGEILKNDLLHRVELIEGYKNEVEPYETARVEAIKGRIREQIEKLGIPVDSARLEQEMIYYLEKLDITEEKVRLKQHCDYFREVAASEEEPGRKLGFIAQEMGREINTLGSKSNQADMQILVVKMKDELEKIKEQVLNVL